jgi:voltage-gated potassium channel Kch
MAITPLLLLINEKLVQPVVEKNTNEETADVIEETGNPIVIAGFGRFGITLGRLLFANGFKATILDSNPDNIQVLRKFGVKVYYGDATRPDLLHAAGCADAKVLVIALEDKEKSLQIVEHVQREYPHIKILARSVSKNHAYEYIKRDIHDYEHDMFNSSLELGMKVLTELGFNRYQAQRAARTFRHADREMEKELFNHYDSDEQKYISEAQRLSAELEKLLRSENDQSIHEYDTAWDNTTLREEAKKIFAELNSESKDDDDDS